MFVVVVSKVRQKTMAALRVLVIGALLIFLLAQAYNLIASRDFTSSWFKEQKPTGNPMRVENKAEEKETKADPVDQFIQSLKNYYQKNQ